AATGPTPDVTRKRHAGRWWPPSRNRTGAPARDVTATAATAPTPRNPAAAPDPTRPTRPRPRRTGSTRSPHPSSSPAAAACQHTAGEPDRRPPNHPTRTIRDTAADTPQASRSFDVGDGLPPARRMSDPGPVRINRDRSKAAKVGVLTCGSQSRSDRWWLESGQTYLADSADLRGPRRGSGRSVIWR